MMAFITVFLDGDGRTIEIPSDTLEQAMEFVAFLREAGAPGIAVYKCEGDDLVAAGMIDRETVSVTEISG